MRRKPLNTMSRSKLSKLAKPLANLAILLADAGSRLERRFWKKRLFAALAPILEGQSDTTLVQTLDHLYSNHYRAYDELAFMIENTVESPTLGNSTHDTLLIALPILAWSTYQIPWGNIEEAALEALCASLQAEVLAQGVQVVLGNLLFSPDQLPETYTAVAALSRQLCQAALDNAVVHIDKSNLPEAQGFLSDVRYVIGAVAAPLGQPVFRWQEERNGSMANKADVLEQWRAQGSACLQKILPGCDIELLLPNGLYSACRSAEQEARGHSVRASAAFLEQTLQVPSAKIYASVGAFVEHGEIEEYRIGFGVDGNDDVLHGVVWPLIGEEYGNEPDPMYEKDIESEPDNVVVRQEIERVLKAVGIRHVKVLEERFPLEYCEDCGAPLYPNPDGELMHAELPEDSNLPDLNQQLH